MQYKEIDEGNRGRIRGLYKQLDIIMKRKIIFSDAKREGSIKSVHSSIDREMSCVRAKMSRNMSKSLLT